jgi:hypothetical protein
MAILLGVLLLAVIAIVTTQLRRRHEASDLGWMSEKWLEHGRSSRVR